MQLTCRLFVRFRSRTTDFGTTTVLSGRTRAELASDAWTLPELGEFVHLRLMVKHMHVVKIARVVYV